MYKLICFLILITVFSIEKIFIRNIELPNCFNCLHFIEYKNNYPYNPIPYNIQYGRCKKFGEVNLIYGAIEYDFLINVENLVQNI